MKKIFLILLVFVLVVPVFASAHSGRTNAEGCHNNRKTGDYHCHGKKTVAKQETKTSAKISARTVAKADYNCTDFSTYEEAQSFYERNGGPLIDPHNLDRDKDGIACESL